MEITFIENGRRSLKKSAVPDDGLSGLRGKSPALFPPGFPSPSKRSGGRRTHIHNLVWTDTVSSILTSFGLESLAFFFASHLNIFPKNKITRTISKGGENHWSSLPLWKATPIFFLKLLRLPPGIITFQRSTSRFLLSECTRVERIHTVPLEKLTRQRGPARDAPGRRGGRASEQWVRASTEPECGGCLYQHPARASLHY